MNSDFIDAIFESDLDRIYRLIDDCVDLNAVGPRGKTPLMTAAENEDVRVIELLISRGANVNAPGIEGYTPLHVAVDMSIDGTIQAGGQDGDEPLGIINLLLFFGADSAARNDKGHTVLDIARHYAANKVIKCLETSCASAKLKDNATD